MSLPSLGEALREATRRIDRLDARLLLQHVSGCTHADLIARPERELGEGAWEHLRALVDRRTSGEPLAYLLGSADFRGREFAVTPAVLVPRADTEVLVEQALCVLSGMAGQEDAARVLDLGTGSGIVAVTLACEVPRAQVTAVDLSPAALAVAAANAARHGAKVRFLAGDWYAPLEGERFDLIVSNPPYIVAGDPHLGGDGVRFEPGMALSDGVAGGDGLACIRAIVAGAPAHLEPGGRILIEHGYDQAVAVRALLRERGFSETASWRDLAGIERVSGGRLS